jgi:hypothetical protein
VRRLYILRGIQDVSDLVWVFLLDARQREGGESSGGWRVEPAGSALRKG